MQKVKIPLKIDPYRAASKRLDYDGIIPKENLLRLAEMVEAILTDIEVHLSFGVDLQGLTAIEGKVGTAVKCVCQRCGKDFDLELKVDFAYTPDQKKVETLGLATEYDFVDLDEFGEVDICSLIEDELILELPSFPKHELADCSAQDNDWVVGEIKEEPKTNPFAVLKELKK